MSMAKVLSFPSSGALRKVVVKADSGAFPTGGKAPRCIVSTRNSASNADKLPSE